MSIVDFTCGINPAASVRKPDVHKDKVGTVSGYLRNSVTGGSCYGANLVTKLNHQHCEIHGDKRFVLGNQDSHLAMRRI